MQKTVHVITPLYFLSMSGGIPQGLTLAQPEVVPFRLTQNMIDGYGVSGIEGVFRRTAEITLQARRPISLVP